MKTFQREKRVPAGAAACFYILIGAVICSALFLYGSSMQRHSAAASSGSIFEVSASGEETSQEDSLTAGPEENVSDSAGTQEAPAEPVSDAEEHYYTFVTVNVKSSLHVRQKPGMDAQIVSRLAPGTSGYVLERGEDWSLIKTSDVTGYVSNRYLQFQEIPKEEYLLQEEDASQ